MSVRVPLVVISTGHAFTHWYPATFYLILSFIGQELGLSYTEIGLLITVRYLSGTVFNVPGGIMVDLVGKRPLFMVLALAWVGIPYALIGIFERYAVILACMMLIGLGNSLWHPAAVMELSSGFPGQRGWVLGIHSAAGNAGDVLAPLVTGVLLLSLRWQEVLVLNMLVGIIAALLIWSLLRKGWGHLPDSSEGGANGAVPAGMVHEQRSGVTARTYVTGLGKALKNRDVGLLALLAGVRAFVQRGLLIFLPQYFVRELVLSSAVSGLYMSVIYAAGSAAGPLAGLLSDKLGRKKVVSAGLLSASLALLGLAVFQWHGLFIVMLGLMGFFLYSLRPVVLAWMMEATSREYGGTVVGLQFGVQSLFSSLAPLLGGIVADRWGMMTNFYVLASVVVATNVLVFSISEKRSGKAAT